MTVVWVVLEMMFLFLFYQLPSAIEPVDSDSDKKKQQSNVTDDDSKELSLSSSSECEQSKNDTSIDGKGIYKNTSKQVVDIDSATGETTPLLSAQMNKHRYSLNKDLEKSESVTEGGHVSDGYYTKVPGNDRLAKSQHYSVFVASRMIREEIVVLLAVLFLTVFSQTAIEVCICLLGGFPFFLFFYYASMYFPSILFTHCLN